MVAPVAAMTTKKFSEKPSEITSPVTTMLNWPLVLPAGMFRTPFVTDV